jgi:hypothetical protein
VVESKGEMVATRLCILEALEQALSQEEGAQRGSTNEEAVASKGQPPSPR